MVLTYWVSARDMKYSIAGCVVVEVVEGQT